MSSQKKNPLEKTKEEMQRILDDIDELMEYVGKDTWNTQDSGTRLINIVRYRNFKKNLSKQKFDN